MRQPARNCSVFVIKLNSDSLLAPHHWVWLHVYTCQYRPLVYTHAWIPFGRLSQGSSKDPFREASSLFSVSSCFFFFFLSIFLSW